MSSKSRKYEAYEINFPGGKLVYYPREGKMIDLLRNKTFRLPEKRHFSFLPFNNHEPGDFKPICLTIYDSHRCNLNCTYCYIPEKTSFPDIFIDPEAVEAGARLVATNCKNRNLPFVVGFHGGNEPLLNPDKLDTYLSVCEKVARENKLEFLPFCTTNGTVPESTIRWAAGRFFGISLSWDGPPDIHNAFRTHVTGSNTSHKVVRAAKIFLNSLNGPQLFRVRCTISSYSVECMKQITRYFHEHKIKIVEFYPVFMDRHKTIDTEMIPDAAKFVYHFLKARVFGESVGMQVLFSGSRINDFHNRYCMTLQDNLTITPDGHLTNCYHCTQNFNKKDSPFIYGAFNQEMKEMVIDNNKLGEISQKYHIELNECTDCFNQFHCAHGCPDICPFSEDYQVNRLPDCNREKWLGLAGILEAAGYKLTFGSETVCTDFFRNIHHKQINQHYEKKPQQKN